MPPPTVMIRTMLQAVMLVLSLTETAAFSPPPSQSSVSRPRSSSPSRSSGSMPLRMAGFAMPDILPNLFGGAGSSKNRLEDEREESKLFLRRLVADTKRGKGAGDDEREEIFAAMESLEVLNPTVDFGAALLSAGDGNDNTMDGKWSLLYTSAASADDAERRRSEEGAIGSAVTELAGASDSAAAAAPRGLGQVLGEDDDAPLPLGRRLTTLAAGVVDNRGNFQDIDVANGRVENRAEFAVFGAPASVRILGKCERVDGEAARLAVFFEEVELKISSLAVTLPLTWANEGKGPEGWVDTTYLDSDLRCGRGDKGSFFIAARRPN